MIVWQPIESAPKDETFILLYFPKANEEDVYEVGFWSIEYEDWYESECSSFALTFFDGQPTHWCPLLPP